MEIENSPSRPTFSGLATGIDTALLIEGLMGIERRPLTLLETRRDDLKSQQSLFREFNTKLLALRDAARGIDNFTSALSGNSFEEEFLAFDAESTSDSVVKAIASSSASAGEYEVRVTQLATVGRSITQAFASNTDVIAASGETLTIDFSDAGETDFTVNVGAGGASLQNLRDAINLSADNDGRINAEILFDGSQYRLIVSGTETGVVHGFSVSGTGATLGDPGFIDSGLGQAAGDAALEVLGVPVTSSSNTVEGALPGVTLELTGTNDALDPTDFEILTVTLDDEGVEEKLQGLVDAYNDLASLFAKQFKVNEETSRGGPLSNDSLLRSLQGTLQQVMGAVYTSPSTALDPYATLSSIGIRFDAESRLSLDSDDLREALAADPRAVRTLLSGDGTGDGAATALARRLEPIVRFGDGTLSVRDQSLDRQIEGLDQQIERFEARLAIREDTLLTRFSRLEAAVSTLQAQSFFFGRL